MLPRLLEILFPVRPGERRLTLLLFLQSTFAVGAFVAGRSVRDALFLAHLGRADLAWMYVASAAGVTAFGLAYTPLARRVRRDTLAVGCSGLFSALFAVFFAAERTHAAWVYPALYVYVEVMGALTVLQLWTLANELFNAREAKRLYGFIGAGGTASNIAVGVATGKIATQLGASYVLILCALLMAGCALVALAASREGRQRLFAHAAQGRRGALRLASGASRVFASAHLKTVALLAAVTFVTVTWVDFQFKVAASEAFSQDRLAAYFGYFYAVVGVLALALQLFGTSRLLQRAGVIGTLAVLPGSLTLGNLGFALFPGLAAASLTRGADTLFRYSVNDATTQILYLPVAPHLRASAKAFIDGVVKPLAIGVGGLCLLGYRYAFAGSPAILAWAGVGLGITWLVMVGSLRSHYIQSLQDNLRHRRLDLESATYRVRDRSTHAVLETALTSGDAREVLNALELLPHLEDVNLDNRVEPLLDHPNPEIRLGAVTYYGRRQTLRFANAIFRKFEDTEPRIRAAAIDCFCSMGKDKAIRSVKSFLNDGDPGVRSAAITGMIRYGGLDGVLVAAEALKQLIAHTDVVMREHAARVLGAIGVKNFYQPVLELMKDAVVAVRRQAIGAAGALKSQEFVIPLIYKLQSPQTRREAVAALAQFDASIVPTLGTVLANKHESADIRRGVARVLGKLATDDAVRVITRQLNDPDPELRTRLYRSLAKAARARRLVDLDRPAVQAAFNAELVRAFDALTAAETLRLGPGPGAQTPRTGPAAADALLSSALSEKVARAEQHLFLLLSVLYPEADMERIHASIKDAAPAQAARRRADAVELLDNLLARDQRRLLLPLLEDMPRAAKLKAVADVLPMGERAADATVVALCQDESSWVRACAIFYAAQVNCGPAAETIAQAAGDVSPVVREVSLISCLDAAPERAAAIAQAHLADEAPVVRRRAALIANGRA